MGINQHVVPHERDDGNKWAVKSAGIDVYTSYHKTQAEAIDVARDIARKEKSELYIHGRDGKIRARDSYGNDPRSSKG